MSIDSGHSSLEMTSGLGIEKFFLRTNEKVVEPIGRPEIAELLNNEVFLEGIMNVNNLMQSNKDLPGYEAGLMTVREIESSKPHIGTVVEGSENHIDLRRKSEFISLPDSAKSGYSLVPLGLTDNDDDRNTWSTLDIANLHFHPNTVLTGENTSKKWFAPSEPDKAEIGLESTLNSLKIRSREGMPVHHLRSMEDEENDKNISEYALQLREQHYGYFLKSAFGSSEKLSPADPGSAEAEYRVFQMIGMSLSSDKAQILMLYDDPSKARQTSHNIPQPEAFSREPFDLENDKASCREVIEYYQNLGYQAEIVFVEKGRDNKTKSRIFH